ncbi:MAG TPA: hypothetical protein VKY15_05890, partial [Acidimicrobiales bacterium]|nr:hypothetical protein [Acidimicrobiales bacterium]
MARRVTDWHLGLYLITVLAFGWRVFTVLHWYAHPVVWGDAFYYHGAANLLVEGHGLVNPFPYASHHRLVPSEDFPPLFTLYLAAASAVGATSFFAHQIWCCVLGAATVPVVGLAGREAAGPAVGLMAAAVAAFYPNFWIPNGQVLSETLAMFMTAVVLLAALRFWRRPRLAGAAGLGAAIGLAALARDELLSSLVLLALPLALLARQGAAGPRPWSRTAPGRPRLAWAPRLKMAGLAFLSAAVVIAPWSAYNATRFQRFELISAGLG